VVVGRVGLALALGGFDLYVVLGHSSRRWLGYRSWVQNPLLRTVCEGVKVREFQCLKVL
jgi:hypothetical protein